MKIQMPLKSFKGKNSVDEQNAMHFDLYKKERALRGDNVISDFSLFEQYNIERDSCDKYRFIFTVNPICSNVLFNVQTEITQFEGSESANVITSTSRIAPQNVRRADTYDFDNAIQNASAITRYQALIDTEYSHEANGGFEYHCGVDIFNNHLLRKNGFVHINKYNQNDTESPWVYNTIRDFIRDGDGNIVKMNVSPLYNRDTQTKMHLYTIDNCMSLKDAYIEKVDEENGWIGFTNPTNIEIANNSGDTVMINRMFANRKACEFIDMYPDRTLFSFLPKYNKYRHRYEKNWDYCITYPFQIDYDLFDEIFNTQNQAMRTIAYSGTNVNSMNVIFCRSLIKHNLNRGDTISVYYKNSGVFQKFDETVQILAIGDNEGNNSDFIFSIKYNDVDMIASFILANGLFFKKTINGIECAYYFRKYKHLYMPDENGTRKIELKSELGKCAYAENIYGDRIAEVVFTDDIDLSGLVDHRGRKLTQTYLTVIKNNKGNDLWYNERRYGDENIEFSHCFGNVSSGLYFGEDVFDTSLSGYGFDYNIHYLHNIKKTKLFINYPFSALGETILRGKPRTLNIDEFVDSEDFCGDVVEFDYYNYIETELSPVLHRFNTIQREWCDDMSYADLTYDMIQHDDFDINEFGNNPGFGIDTTNLNRVSVGNQYVDTFSNIRPEGYYYNPHTLIMVGEEDLLPTRANGKRINFTDGQGSYNSQNDITSIEITSPVNYGFLKHSHMALFDAGGSNSGFITPRRTIWGEVTDIDNTRITIEFNGDVFYTSSGVDIDDMLNPSGSAHSRYSIYWCEVGVPVYANFVPEISSFVWRSVVPPSKMTNDMELYNTPFANGRFYIEKNIVFPVRRQDKDGRFGLSYGINSILKQPTEYFNIDGEDFNIEGNFNFDNNVINVCY